MSQSHILIVEDEEKIARFIELELRHEGYKVIKANNGRDGLEIAERGEADLVILDVMLPEINGLEVLRRLRKTSDIPVIMLTARGEEQDELFGFELGVDEYISKPFSPKILVARVEAILKRTNQTQSFAKDYGGIELDKNYIIAKYVLTESDYTQPVNGKVKENEHSKSA